MLDFEAMAQWKILVADSAPQIRQVVEQAFPQAKLKFVPDGAKCLEMLESFQPDILIIDQFLPGIHGVEILKKIRAKGSKMGVVLSTWRALIQDYRTAVENGADYYLLKPFSIATIHRIAQYYFDGKLKPVPFPLVNLRAVSEIESYNPHIPQDEPYIKFWGTRGSISVAGPEYISFGGNTPCLEISHPDAMVIIDAGTGIRALGHEAVQRRFKDIHIIIGHTHWDHILGFPFFAPVYSSEYTIHIYAAKGFGKRIEDLFRGMLDRDYFPVKLDEMQAKFVFHDIDNETPINIGPVTISADWAIHPGATLCFRIDMAGHRIGYVTDNELLAGFHGHPKEIDRNHPLLAPSAHLLEFFAGCDLMIHEAQYMAQGYRTKVGWGHSSLPNAAAFINQLNPPEWIITHHDPADTDHDLRTKEQLAQQILTDLGSHTHVRVAYDEMQILL